MRLRDYCSGQMPYTLIKMIIRHICVHEMDIDECEMITLEETKQRNMISITSFRRYVQITAKFDYMYSNGQRDLGKIVLELSSDYEVIHKIKIFTYDYNASEFILAYKDQPEDDKLLKKVRMEHQLGKGI